MTKEIDDIMDEKINKEHADIMGVCIQCRDIMGVCDDVLSMSRSIENQVSDASHLIVHAQATLAQTISQLTGEATS